MSVPSHSSCGTVPQRVPRHPPTLFPSLWGDTRDGRSSEGPGRLWILAGKDPLRPTGSNLLFFSNGLRFRHRLGLGRPGVQLLQDCLVDLRFVSTFSSVCHSLTVNHPSTLVPSRSPSGCSRWVSFRALNTETASSASCTWSPDRCRQMR